MFVNSTIQYNTISGEHRGQPVLLWFNQIRDTLRPCWNKTEYLCAQREKEIKPLISRKKINTFSQ